MLHNEARELEKSAKSNSVTGIGEPAFTIRRRNDGKGLMGCGNQLSLNANTFAGFP